MKKNLVIGARSVGIVSIVIATVFLIMSFNWLARDSTQVFWYYLVHTVAYILIPVSNVLFSFVLVFQKVLVSRIFRFKAKEMIFAVIYVTVMNIGMIIILIDLYS